MPRGGRLPPIPNDTNSSYWRIGTLANPESLKVSRTEVYCNCCTNQSNNMKLVLELYRIARYSPGAGAKELNSLFEKHNCNSWCYSYSVTSGIRSWHSSSIHFHRGARISDELIHEYMAAILNSDDDFWIQRAIKCCKEHEFDATFNPVLRSNKRHKTDKENV